MKNSEVIEYFNKVSNKLRDNNSKLLSLISYLIKDQTCNRFNTETDPNNKKWAPNSEVTLAAYFARTKRKDKKILTDYGMLKNIFFQVQTTNKAIIGTDKSYGRVMQFGTTKIPARPYLGVNHQNKQEIIRIIHDYLKE